MKYLIGWDVQLDASVSATGMYLLHYFSGARRTDYILSRANLAVRIARRLQSSGLLMSRSTDFDHSKVPVKWLLYGEYHRSSKMGSKAARDENVVAMQNMSF